MTLGDMKDWDLQSSMSLILPPQDGEAVPAYLTAVTRALGGRTDAALARSMGQPAHVLANWRRRQRVPDEHLSWFSTSLVEKIGTYNPDLPSVGLTARAAVIRLISETGGNPIGAKQRSSDGNGLALGALLAFAQFLIDVTEIHGAGGVSADDVAQRMKPLMRILAKADHLRAYIAVPQQVPQ